MPDGAVRCPTAKAEKSFLFSKGKLGLERSLDKEVYYHGQEIPITLSINNNTNKSVKTIRVAIVQHCFDRFVGVVVDGKSYQDFLAVIIHLLVKRAL